MSTIHEEWHRALCQMLIHCRGDGGGSEHFKGERFRDAKKRKWSISKYDDRLGLQHFIKDQRRFEQCQKIK